MPLHLLWSLCLSLDEPFASPVANSNATFLKKLPLMPIPVIPAELGLKVSSHRLTTLYLLVFPGLALSLAR